MNRSFSEFSPDRDKQMSQTRIIWLSPDMIKSKAATCSKCVSAEILVEIHLETANCEYFQLDLV